MNVIYAGLTGIRKNEHFADVWETTDVNTPGVRPAILFDVRGHELSSGHGGRFCCVFEGPTLRRQNEFAGCKKFVTTWRLNQDEKDEIRAMLMEHIGGNAG